MNAFENTTMTKDELLTELKWHQSQDNFIKGSYWEDGKGCAVGCSLESLKRKKSLDISIEDHFSYEKHFGIPAWLAKVEDKIFEGVSLQRSKTWPVEFIEAINTSADLNKIKAPFLIFVLKSTLDKFDHDKYSNVKKSIDTVISLYENGETDLTKFKTAASASAAAYAYDASASYDADAAAYDASASASASAAAYADAYAAVSAAATAAAAKKSRTKTYEMFADELIRLIKECK